jgi:hypothetical protein
MHDLPQSPESRQGLQRGYDVKRTDRDPGRFKIVGILTTAAQAHDMLRQTTMMQSYRGLHEHTFGSAKPEPTDHMQDGRHSSNLTTNAFGRDATEVAY